MSRENSRTENSIKNITSSWLYQLLTVGLSFVNRTVFLYCLSIDYLGISGLFGDIFAMLSLADLGFGTAMAYSMYKPLAENDHRKLAELTGFYKKVYRMIVLVVVSAGVLLTPFLQYLVRLDSDMPYLKIYYLFYLANAAASYMVCYKTCILNADQKSYLLTKYTGIFNVLGTLCMTVFLFLTRNFIVYLFIQVLFTYLNNFYASHVVDKMYPYLKEKASLPKQEEKEIFQNIKSIFLYKISGVLLNATDSTLISVLFGTALVGYYSNYMLIVARLSGFIDTMFYSLTASLGNLIVLEEQKKRYEIFRIIQSVSSILTTICVTCLFLLEEDLIRIWLGEQYVLDKALLWAVTVNFYLYIILLPIWVFREATGLYQKTKYVMLITAVLNLVLSIILGQWIGIAGIVFASAISRLLTYVWVEPKLLFKAYFGKTCLTYYMGIAKNLIVTAGVLTAGYFLFGSFAPADWLTLIGKACGVGAFCVLIAGLIYSKEEGLKLIFDKLKTKLKNLMLKY